MLRTVIALFFLFVASFSAPMAHMHHVYSQAKYQEDSANIKKDSAYSSYLVGNYALEHGDFDNATKFLSQAIADDTRAMPEALDRLICSCLYQQDFASAYQYAAKNKNGKNFDVAKLLNISNAFKDKNFDYILSVNNSQVESPVDYIVAAVLNGWAYYGKGDYKKATHLLQMFLKRYNSSFKTGIVLKSKVIAPNLMWKVIQNSPEVISLIDYHLALMNYAYSPQKAEYYFKQAIEAYKDSAVDNSSLYIRILVGYIGLLQEQGRFSESAALLNQAYKLFPKLLLLDAINISVKKHEKIPDNIFVGINKVSDKEFYKKVAVLGAAEILANAAVLMDRYGVLNSAYIYASCSVDLGRENYFARWIESLVLAKKKVIKYANIYNKLEQIPKSSLYYTNAQLQKAYVASTNNQHHIVIDELKNLYSEYHELKDYNKMVQINIMLINEYLTIGQVSTITDLWNENVTVLTEESCSADSYYQMANIAARLYKIDKAVAYFTKAVQKQPDSYLYLRDFAKLLIAKKIRSHDALTMLEKSYQLNPSDIETLQYLGIACGLEGKDGEAINYLKKAAHLDVTNFKIVEALGDVYWKKGDKNRAIMQWINALSLANENEDKARLEGKIGRALVSR